MSYEGTPVKAPPNTRRRMMPPTPQQCSHSSIEERQWQAEMEVQESFWSARERTVIAKMESYLDKSYDVRVAFRELEHLCGPRRLGSRMGSSMFEIFSTSGSDHLVASRIRWIKYQERVQRGARKDGDKGDFCWAGHVKGWQEEC